MWAIQADQYGGPEVLEYKQIPKPDTRPDEVLIKHEYIGVAFGDTNMLQGDFNAPHTYGTVLPYIPGTDGGGVVVEVGSEVADFRIGDRVVYSMDEKTHAQYSAVPDWKVVAVPDDIDMKVALNFVTNGLTAFYLARKLFPITTFFEKSILHPINPGDTVLVLAAGGSVGQILVQLAVQRGARVLAMVGNRDKAALVERLGVKADDVVLYREVDFVSEVRRLTGGRGVDIVYDSVGKDTYLKSMQCLRWRGICALYGAASGRPETVRPMQDLAENGSIFVTRSHCWHHYPDKVSIRAAMGEFYELHRKGDIWMGIEETDFPLSKTADAHRLIKTGKLMGKLFLKVEHDE